VNDASQGATPQWTQAPERGSQLAIRVTVWLALTLGRRVVRLLGAFIAFYFTLFAPRARRAVHTFRAHLGLHSGFFRAYQHILRFTQCAVDAVFLLRGNLDRFRFTRDGHDYLEELRRSKTGAVLLGGHLGSLYAMRAAAGGYRLAIHPLVYTKNARRINDALRAVAPDATIQLIEIEDDGVEFMLRVRDLVSEGAMIAILADRVRRAGQTVEVSFLGGRARLPAGPFLLASTLRCPVYFTVGLHHPPNHYELHCEPFADRIVLERGRRLASVQKYAQSYADRLAHYARAAPENWFNFYDFWAQ
jgi:predicted LPLAT superfamily acyltransferase